MSADVRSIDAVREWQTALTAFGESLSEAMTGVELELRRAGEWLHEQLALWQRAIRKCEEEVVQAKAELAARKFPDYSGREPDTTVQERALRRAKADLEHAEDQVARIRSWIGRLPKMVDEVYRGPAHRLTNFLDGELPKGLTQLKLRIGSLESYAGLRTDYSAAPSASSLQTAPLPRAVPKPDADTGDAK